MSRRAATPDERAGEELLTRRAFVRLAGLALGGVAAAGMAGSRLAGPASEAARGDMMFEYLTDRAKFKSPAFMVANRLADSLPVFGSSELSTSMRDIPQVPLGTFGMHDYGLDLWCVGEGYNQSLWHAIALGAHFRAMEVAGRVRGGVRTGAFDAEASNKAVLIISPQWFYEGGVPANAAQAQFGYGLWRGLCANGRVSDEHKDYLARRLLDLGVDPLRVRAGRRLGVAEAINDVALSLEDGYDLRRELERTRLMGASRARAKERPGAIEGVPDWDSLRASALVEARSSTTTNDFGMLDSFWQAKNAVDFEAGKLEGFLRYRSLTKAPTEDADLDCCLGVAADCGVDLLCVLLPFPGAWADYEQLSQDERGRRYGLMREACGRAGCRVCDLTGEEYTPYFIFDGTHLGWVGWLTVEQAIYEFAMGD